MRRYPANWSYLVRRGLGQVGGDFVSSLASSIQQMEGWGGPGSTVGGVYFSKGTLSYRNNNPGNIRPGTLAVGAIGANGGYATFPDFQTGWNALLGLIQSSLYWNKTLTEFFTTYAPWADNNNPAKYAAYVAGNLGVDPNTPISELASGGGAVAAVPGDSGDGGPPVDSGDASAAAAVPVDTGSSLADAFSGMSPLALGIGVGAVLLAALVL